MKTPSKIVPRPGGTVGTGKRESGRIASQKIRDSAKGEACTFAIPGVCNHDTATTVLCHLPDESHGAGRKSDDLSAAYGCSACHDWIDRRMSQRSELEEADRQWYMRRAQTRTLRRLINKGLVKVAA